MMLGNGLSGLSVNLLRILFLLVLPNNYNASSQIFYYLSSAFVLFCSILSFLFIKRNMSKDEDTPTPVKISARMHAAYAVQKINWQAALGELITQANYMMFFPGVILQYQLSFIPDFSWFVIFVVTYASVVYIIGSFIAGNIDIIPKKLYLLVAVMRAALFTTTYILTYKNVAPEFFKSDAFVLINLGLFGMSYGFVATLGMKFGSDATTGD